MSFVYTTDGEKLHIAYDDNLGEDWDYSYTIDKNVLSLTRVDDDAITMLYELEIPEEESETAGE